MGRNISRRAERRTSPPLYRKTEGVLKVSDSQGNQYEPIGVRQAVGPLINDDERWESQQKNQLMQWVFEDELPRQGPLVFDVPEEATGLKLMMEGTDETIDLGF